MATELHSMKWTSRYAGTKEYYDSYWWDFVCTCGEKRTLSYVEHAESYAKAHERNVRNKALGLKFEYQYDINDLENDIL